MQIRPADLRKDWPWVRPHLEAVIGRTGEKWWAEDIYAAVSSGRALMFVADEPPGVMVCYSDKEQWTAETVLHVWALWSVAGMAQLADEAYALLADVAKRIGAKKLRMESPRKGWRRAGWKIHRYIYEREV